jgi:hypothetical protein
MSERNEIGLCPQSQGLGFCVDASEAFFSVTMSDRRIDFYCFAVIGSNVLDALASFVTLAGQSKRIKRRLLLF